MARPRIYVGLRYNLVQVMTNNIHLFLKVCNTHLCFVTELLCSCISPNNVVS